MNLNIDGKFNKYNLLKMFAYIEFLGSIGHSTKFEVFIDGDGATRIQFNFDDSDTQSIYSNYKKDILDYYNTTREDIKDFKF